MNDTNSLIQLAVEMGLIEFNLNRAVPNSAKCNTWTDIQASHKAEIEEVKFEDVYGMMVFLAIGLVGASFLYVAEKVIWVIRANL